jgi:CRISPR-associated protein Cas1
MINANPSANAALPDYLPARMLNEFVYCPRLFYYEWVEGVFVHNRETTEGALRHAKIDAKQDALPLADALKESGETLHSRSVELSSDKYGLIAKCDLVETSGEGVTPVDYKRGKPRENDKGEIEAWDADAVQLCVQALVLRENGYDCHEGVIYYAMSKQRVRVPINDTLVAQTLTAIEKARETAESPNIPPPLVDSPKCPRCSLVGICLPDETIALEAEFNIPRRTQRTLFDVRKEPTSSIYEGEPKEEIRRLTPARDDLKPLYLNTQGLYVGKSANVIKVKEKEKVVQEVRMHDICQLNVMGNIQLSTQVVQSLCENEIPIAYFSMGGWFYGITNGMGPKNVYLRKEQFRLADSPSFRLRVSRAITAGKIKNQRTMLQRNHVEPPREALNMMKCMQEQAEAASSLESLLGIEGNAAKYYFEHFAGMIKSDPDPFAGNEPAAKAEPEFTFDFEHRNRRPPRDPVNALLSLAYSLLAKDFTIVCQMVGFDPFLGFYHQPRFGRAPLALDLMEPFRPLIADSAVLSAINTRMVTPNSFVRVGPSVALTPDGRKAFFRAYEQRMDSLVTHPLFGYRLNYRRLLEVQTRLLARVLMGELDNYPVFTTR